MGEVKKFAKYLILLAFSILNAIFFPVAAQHQGTEEGSHAELTEGHDSGGKHEEGHDAKFDPASFIFHHIGDDYQFHVIGNISIPLPMIIFVPGKGLSCFTLSDFKKLNPDDHHSALYKEDNGSYFYYHHGKLFIADGLDAHGHPLMDSTGHVIGKHAAKIMDIGSSHVFYNLSITKNVFGMLLAIAIILLIFIPVARTYKRNPMRAPRGFQGALEPFILFVQNDIAKANIGEKKYKKFVPYLLTLFFFIWVNNLMGLIPIFPFSSNVTGNIAITFCLAVFSMILALVLGNKHYWGHILNPPGVPFAVKIILVPIEIVGIFTKPFSLMIRLFANITAGHIIIISIISITFIFESLALGFVTSLFSVVMFMLELLVSVIQAYIFTLLTAMMIGQAMEEGHGHHAENEHAH